MAKVLVVVVLEITSWAGTCPGAVHSYGRLYADGGRIHELKRKLSTTAAAKLNRNDPSYKWEAGEETKGFDGSDAIRTLAKRKWKKLYPDADMLLEGTHGCCDPQRCLAGPPKLRNRINALYKQAKKIGWYDGGHEDEMDKLFDEFWYDVIGHQRR